MKQRLADYVADFLVNHGIKDCFMVTGGGAMHLKEDKVLYSKERAEEFYKNYIENFVDDRDVVMKFEKEFAGRLCFC